MTKKPEDEKNNNLFLTLGVGFVLFVFNINVSSVGRMIIGIMGLILFLSNLLKKGEQAR